MLLYDRMNQAIAHAKRYNLYLGVLLIDLDFFKEVNDTYGHHVGDSLLKLQTKKLVDSLRQADTVARLGGDEFVVILTSQPNEKNIVDFLPEFSGKFSKPCKIEGHEISSTLSIGISIYPQDGLDPETLLKNADTALYQAKKLGRNTFYFYRKELNTPSRL